MANDDAKWKKVEEIISASINVYTFQNDIALVKFGTSSQHQQVIQVAREMPSNNAECLIYGYGSINYNTNTITSNSIRYGRLNLISYELCEDILGRVTAPSEGQGQFCALGKNGVDGCNGE